MKCPAKTMQDFQDGVLILCFVAFLILIAWGFLALVKKVIRMFTGRDVAEAPVESVSITFAISGAEYGSENERRSVQRFAMRLENKLKSHALGEYDGDEFGCGTASLYFFGQSADSLWELIEEDVRVRSPHQALSATLIYGNRPNERKTITIAEAEQ